jgi:O-antigen/teichoic acid export membrane protein
VIREVARAPASAGLLLGSALALRVVGTLVVIVPTLAVAGALGYDVRTRWLALAFIAVNLPLVLAQGFGMVFRGWDLMARDAAVSVANKILTVAIAVPVLYLGEGLWGVLGAQGLAGLGALAVAAWLYRGIGAPRLRFTSEAARAIVIGGTPILAWSVTSAVQPYIDAVVLSRLSSAAAIGWYGAARTVMGTLIAPSTILASASYPSLSRSATTAGTLRTGLRSALRPLFWLGGLGGVGVYLFADLAIGVIYGAKGYGPAAMILKAFAPVLFLLFVDVLLAHALAANGRAKAFAGVKVVSIVISTGLSLYLVQAFQERSGNGGIGLVVAFGLSELVVFGSSIFLLPRGSLDAALLLDAGRAVLAAAATILLFWFLPIATSLAAIPLCIGVFSLLSVVLGLVTRRDLETFKALLAGLRPRDVPSQGP